MGENCRHLWLLALSLSRLLEKFSFIPRSLSKYIYKMVGYSSSSTIPTLSLSRLTLMTRRNLIKVKLEKNVYLMNVAQLSFPFSHSLLAEHFFLWACKTFSLSLCRKWEMDGWMMRRRQKGNVNLMIVSFIIPVLPTSYIYLSSYSSEIHLFLLSDAVSWTVGFSFWW